MTMAIVKHGLPFKFVEYKWIRELLSYLNPGVKHVSRNTIVFDLWKFHVEMKEKLKHEMHHCHNWICLTSDYWTACTQEGYICLTTNFVDNNWKLNSKILAFRKMEPPHMGHDLANKVFDVWLIGVLDGIWLLWCLKVVLSIVALFQVSLYVIEILNIA